MNEEQMSTLLWMASFANFTPEQKAERDRLIAAIEDFRRRVNGESRERYREAGRGFRDPD